jgi:ABC-type glutathione transport system ATPase component
MKLRVSDLRISFGSRQVVGIEELTCDAGQIVGLVGESGSGKSMTATAIMGLALRLGATVTGSIRLDGSELVGLPDSAMRDIRGRRIAMIFQDPASAFNPVIKVGTLFTRALRLHGARSRAAARDRAKNAVAEVLLPGVVLDRYPHQLSGGQLQRVAIALALALEAEVLLADEPTSALDVTVQAEILAILRRLTATRQLAVLLISHDLAVVAEVADAVAVMQSGRLVEVGAARQVLSAPVHAYTRELLSAVPVMAAGGGRVAASE